MVNYECKTCYFETKNKRNYIQHNSTKKHILKVQSIANNIESKSKSTVSPILHLTAPHGHLTDTSRTPHDHCINATNISNDEEYLCEYCLIHYSRMGSLTRHKKICPSKQKHEEEQVLKQQITSCTKMLIKK